MLQRELAIVAADGEEAGGGEALVEGVGEGVADPAEGGLVAEAGFTTLKLPTMT